LATQNVCATVASPTIDIAMPAALATVGAGFKPAPAVA
jgi:hypothetical protein